MSADHPPTPPSLSAPEPPEPAAPAPPVIRPALPVNGADGGPKSERTRQRILDVAETFLHGVLVPGSSGSADRGRMARPGSRAGTGPGPEGGASRTER